MMYKWLWMFWGRSGCFQFVFSSCRSLKLKRPFRSFALLSLMQRRFQNVSVRFKLDEVG